MRSKKGAIDLTELAIGIVILGIIVAIGTLVVLNVRDSQTTNLPIQKVVNETITPSSGVGVPLEHVWVKQIIAVENTSATLLTTTNYTASIDPSTGTGLIKALAVSDAHGFLNNTWKVNYTYYDTSRADWDVGNKAAIGLGEYSSWFKIIVITGVAALILGIIFLAFGKGGGGGSSGGSNSGDGVSTAY